jgi:hypothetical protein
MEHPSFLHFAACELLGLPAEGYAASWYCPFCEGERSLEVPTLSVRPPKQKPNGTWYPIKWKCHNCQFYGDEADLVRWRYPSLSGPLVDRYVMELVREWMRLYPRKVPGGNPNPRFIPDKDAEAFAANLERFPPKNLRGHNVQRKKTNNSKGAGNGQNV